MTPWSPRRSSTTLTPSRTFNLLIGCPLPAAGFPPFATSSRQLSPPAYIPSTTVQPYWASALHARRCPSRG
eukprot:5814079-Lingulodinium_polyedra.AAC.1